MGEQHQELEDLEIVVRLDMILAARKLTSKQLSARIGISEQNLSVLRAGRARGVRFDTLRKLCAALDCQPGDLLEAVPRVGEV